LTLRPPNENVKRTFTREDVMPQAGDQKLYVVEAARRRVVVSAGEAGRARALATLLMFGRTSAPQRDQLVVREPEEEERAVFEALEFAPGAALRLAAVQL
jgi:hypothetical protein